MRKSAIIFQDLGQTKALERLKTLSQNKPVIAGRKTFDLLAMIDEDRPFIVISRDPNLKSTTQVLVVNSILEAWVKAEQQFGADEAFLVGGYDLCVQAVQSCDRIYLSVTDISDFKPINLNDWYVKYREYLDDPPSCNLIIERIKPMVQFVTFERLEGNTFQLPRYETPLSAGLDLAACLLRECKNAFDKKPFWAGDGSVRHTIKPEKTPSNPSILIKPGETIMVPLGWKVALTESVYMQLHVRSSIGMKGLVLANGTGIVDSDYRGELFAVLRCVSQDGVTVTHGDRIVQGIATPLIQSILKEGKVDQTTRGSGGFGSTGSSVVGASPLS